MAMVPSYISRSVAGSYDLEGVSIFALVFTFYLYVKVSDCYCVHNSMAMQCKHCKSGCKSGFISVAWEGLGIPPVVYLLCKDSSICMRT